MPKRYQEEYMQVQEINRRETQWHHTKCSLCNRQGHTQNDCRQVCKYRTNTGTWELCSCTPIHTYQNCPNKALETEQVSTVENQKAYAKANFFCNICHTEGHTTDRCWKVCTNSHCINLEPHHYQNCTNYFCKVCFAYHKITDECNFEAGKHNIINQYIKYDVCECNAVQFYKEKMNRAISTYDKQDIPFFVTYPKPIANRYCRSHIFCEFVKPDGEVCRRHHATEEHGYFA